MADGPVRCGVGRLADVGLVAPVCPGQTFERGDAPVWDQIVRTEHWDVVH